ncbi:MAG: hypothetical protein ACLPZR_31775 [Solirubrobacteraceae bacterium]
MLQGPVPTGTVQQATQLTDLQRDLYTACAITPPPRITALLPA